VPGCREGGRAAEVSRLGGAKQNRGIDKKRKSYRSAGVERNTVGWVPVRTLIDSELEKLGENPRTRGCVLAIPSLRIEVDLDRDPQLHLVQHNWVHTNPQHAS